MSTSFSQKVATANQTAICSATHNVGRKTIREILQMELAFRVPIFQRRYCWTDVQWETLFTDAHSGLQLGRHSLGRLTCTHVSSSRDDSVDGEMRSMILDGQQRITTVTLLLASIRDALELLSTTETGPPDPMVETINRLLFSDTEQLKVWIQEQADRKCDNPVVSEGTELPFAKLIPSFCDRRSYFAAILPNQVGSFLDNTATWHRPLKAKRHFDSKLQNNLRTKKELYRLAKAVLDGFHMLYFPIDIDQGRNDGTEDMMVVYERLALRDATFCKPHREQEYVSMDGVDMIRNLMLGSFGTEREAVEFYQSVWLPVEMMADGAMAATTRGAIETSTSSNSNQNKNKNSQTNKSEDSLMKQMILAFLATQKNRPPSTIKAGIVGGQEYARFHAWLEMEVDKFKAAQQTLSQHNANVIMLQIGKQISQFAQSYFQREIPCA